MKHLSRLILSSALLASGSLAFADQEASNVAHVTASADGRCYAKSVPRHLYDPQGEPRQQGRTILYRVLDGQDEQIAEYDWFSQQLIVGCGPPGTAYLVRLGPWHRGHEPDAKHLAVAFYRNGALLKTYSTLDFAGGIGIGLGGVSRHKNVVASVSHYTVFTGSPVLGSEAMVQDDVYRERWFVRMETNSGQIIRFDLSTGAIF